MINLWVCKIRKVGPPNIAEELWDSIAADQKALPLTDEQKTELDRRLDAYEVDRNHDRIASESIRDPDHSAGEHRFLTLGRSANGRLLAVSHTDNDDIIRIISAREVTRHERKDYEG